MTIGDRIRKQRKSLGITQAELARKLGVSRNLVYKYETNVVTNIPSNNIEKIAVALFTTPAYLMGWDDNVTPIEPDDEETVRIPVYGTVPAGVPIEAIEDKEGYVTIPASMFKGGKRFIALRVKGNSMYPLYLEGDTVIVEVTPDFCNGQDVVVYVNGYDATLKRIYKEDDKVILKPINPEYMEMVYTLQDEPVRVLGVVRELRRTF